MYAQPIVHKKSAARLPSHGGAVATGDIFRAEGVVMTLALTGLECHVVRVTAHVERGPASFEIADITEARVRETRVRVRAALQGLGVELREERVTIHFDRPELVTGGAADLAIAIAVLVATGTVDAQELMVTAIVGELSLTGAIRPVRGVLPMLMGAANRGIRCVIVPRENGCEAASATGIRVQLAEHITELVRHFREGAPLATTDTAPTLAASPVVPDLSDIRGLVGARRALEIAAAGGHGLLIVGPPGAGKTMLARRLPGILPALSAEEAIEITSIFSVAGLVSRERPYITTHPFRAPHHTVSAAGLVGGGEPVRPGEVTLAHNGVLFLDEVVEFKSSALESLAMVLRDGHATLVRRGLRATFPASPLLIAATNPCPCGYLDSSAGRCRCPPERIASYRARLRMPLIETIDVRVTAPVLDVSDPRTAERGEPSLTVRERVTRARAAQAERARITSSAQTNAALGSSDLERFAMPDAAGSRVLADATEQLALSAAQCGRVLRVARTIADLDGSDAVRAPHVAEALTLTVTGDVHVTPSTSTGDGHAA